MEQGARLVLAGIDEAGLGPLLGSLAIGYVLLEVPAEAPHPWKGLRGVVTRKRGARKKGAHARVMVADSKMVFERNPRGAARLESTALSFLAQKDGGRIESSAERVLFGVLSPPPPWRALPWSQELPALPAACSRDSIELTSTLVARALGRARMQLLDAGVRLVPARELNASFEETGNKATSVWNKVVEVLRHIWAARLRAPVHATVDMLGGRRHYGSLLARALPEASVELESESTGRSAYRLKARDGSGEMHLEFRIKADRHCFEVALASCLAKYARELEMGALNRFFARLQPDLTPTAGYRGDGSRWLAEAEPALARSGLARELLVRTR